MSEDGLKGLVLADLARAQRLMQRTGAELDPQFRVATPDGDWWLSLPLTDDAVTRARQLGLVSSFMAWKMCPAFTQAFELKVPDAVGCVGVSHAFVVCALAEVRRGPLRFGEPQWLPRAAIGDDVVALLPRGARSIHDAEMAELTAMFGAEGEYPAVHIGTGAIGA